MNRWAPIVIAILLAGCQKSSEVKQPIVESDILSIEHMEFGLELFKVDEASFNLYQDEDGILEFVVWVSCSEAIKRSKDLVDIVHAKPNFEATAVLPDNEIELSAGAIITQEAGYDYERDENLSNIYYFNHNSIEELKIELIEVTDEWIDAKVTGAAIINGSNGVKPDSKLSVRTKFKRDEQLRRGIS